MINKYFEIVKKTTIDYVENRISASEFKETFQKLNEAEIYEDLDKNEYKGVSNFVSAIQELDDQSTLESQWIVSTIDDFYAYFTNNYDYVYAKDFYKFLKLGLNKENKNPVKTSFEQAIKSYLNKKISSDCLAYIANEFLDNLKFFQKEIKEDKKLFNILKTASNLKSNKILEDLTSKEENTKKEIDIEIKNYLR